MEELSLSYGGLLYWDRTLTLLLKQVQSPGVDLGYDVHESAPKLFEEQIRTGRYDLCEMSAASFLVQTAREATDFVGLPIYISRNFRHGQIYVNRSSGIHKPGDLKGKRVGVLDYQMTAAVWIRAFLQHDYGVLPTDLSWFTGGLTSPEWVERLPESIPSGILMHRIGAAETLEAMLAAGALDALITAQPPLTFDQRADGPIQRLLSDYQHLEQQYFARTGIFPIMHLVVLRRSLYEEHPGLATAIVEAFQTAKVIGQRRLRATTGLAVGLPWLGASLETVDQLFGGDAFRYGVSANEVALSALVGYAYEQGLTKKLVDPADLCAPAVRSWHD